MSSLSHQPDDPTPDALPESLTRDLSAIYARDVRVPEPIDAAILADARVGFARRRRFRLALRGAAVAAGAAAAALVVLALRLVNPDPAATQSPVAQHQPESQASQRASLLARAEDVDHSGRVDILDAFVVARLLEVQGRLDEQAHDVNGDGKVDQSDVDRIAMVAVDTSSRVVDDGRVQ